MKPPRIDFGKTVSDYLLHRPPFDPRLFDRLHHLHIGLPGQLILDVGAGTGLVAQQMQGDIIQCDASHALLARAKSNSKVVCLAEHLPFADQTFDVAVAAQCWHWFDRTIAPREILRTLKPRAHIAILYQTHLPIPGNIAHTTEKLILSLNPGWRHAHGTGINGQALKDLDAAGFQNIQSFTFDTPIPFTRAGWHGNIRTTSAVGPSLAPDKLARFDQQHQLALQNLDEPLIIPHRIFAAFANRP